MARGRACISLLLLALVAGALAQDGPTTKPAPEEQGPSNKLPPEATTKPTPDGGSSGAATLPAEVPGGGATTLPGQVGGGGATTLPAPAPDGGSGGATTLPAEVSPPPR
jgi:hypothetical protein